MCPTESRSGARDARRTCAHSRSARALCGFGVACRPDPAGIDHACIPTRTPIGVIRPAERPASSFRVERGANRMTEQRWNRRELIQAAGAAGPGRPQRPRARAEAAHRRLHLRRRARRLRLQPVARRRGGAGQEDARREGGRGRERARDQRRAEDHAGHDLAGRRHAAVPDLVRLLRPAHPGAGAARTRTCASRTAAACGRRASTRRTSAASSATSTRRSTSTASSRATRPRARSSASSPPSRSRRCCATSTPSRWARAR